MTLESHRHLILFKGSVRGKTIHVNKIFLDQRTQGFTLLFCENVVEKQLFAFIRKYHPSCPSSYQLWETCMEGRCSQTGLTFCFLNTNLCPTENAPSGVLIHCDLDGLFFSS